MNDRAPAIAERDEATERVAVTVHDAVADVVLARPCKHNALDRSMFAALAAAIEELAGARSVRAVVLRGEGPSFCSGLDFPSFLASGSGPDELLARREQGPANVAQQVAYGWRALPVPVICAVHGACFGGGLQIALGADIRIGAPEARLSVMEIEYGLVPDMGLSQTLPSCVREDRARELIYTGRVVDGAEAAELGLLTRLDIEPAAAAAELAERIASRSPDAIRAAKRLVNEGFGAAPDRSLALEAELQRGLLGTPNQIAAASAKLTGEPARFADPD